MTMTSHSPTARLSDQQARANAFILERSEQIEKYTRKFCGSLDLDEYRQEVYFQVVRRHHTLRLADAFDREAVVSTWLGWQCKAARKIMLRRFDAYEARCVRSVDTGDEDGPLWDRTLIGRMATTSTDPGHADRMVDNQEVRAVLKMANQAEKVAIVCLINGWNREELREHVGITEGDRDRAIRSLARKVYGPGAAP